MFRTLFSWFWLLLNLGVLWFLLAKVRNSFPKAFLTIALMLYAASGLSNGLVMTANGCRMPVEEIESWENVPTFFSEPGVFHGWARKSLGAFDPKTNPDGTDDVHLSAPEKRSQGRTVYFAFLDDRIPIIIAGQHQILSPGDLMFILGTLLLLSGFALYLLRGVWRTLKRRFTASA